MKSKSRLEENWPLAALAGDGAGISEVFLITESLFIAIPVGCKAVRPNWISAFCGRQKIRTAIKSYAHDIFVGERPRKQIPLLRFGLRGSFVGIKVRSLSSRTIIRTSSANLIIEVRLIQ